MKKIKERWKDVVGYEGLYEVSDMGRVRNGKKRILFLRSDPNGYPNVCLCKDGVKKSYRVHRLVSRAFLGDLPEGYCTDHINRDKTDNRLCNLRYVNYQENNVRGIAVLCVVDGMEELSSIYPSKAEFCHATGNAINTIVRKKCGHGIACFPMLGFTLYDMEDV